MFHSGKFTRVAKIEKWAVTFAMVEEGQAGNVFATTFL